jgi:hypothetical protein
MGGETIMSYEAWAVAALLFAVGVGSALGATTGPKRMELDVEAMLWAIRQVESGDNPHAVGQLGERGAYQFRASTWYEYTKAKFIMADSVYADDIARRHLSRICAALFRRKETADPALIAAAWRFGIGNAVRCASADSARRTANLYFDRVKQKGARP